MGVFVYILAVAGKAWGDNFTSRGTSLFLSPDHVCWKQHVFCYEDSWGMWGDTIKEFLSGICALKRL